MKPHLGYWGLGSRVSVAAAIAMTVGCFPPALDLGDGDALGQDDGDGVQEVESPFDGTDALEDILDGREGTGEAPVPPEGVTATTERDDAVLVQWTASLHATGYKLFRCAGTCGEAGPWTALLPVAIAATNYPDESAAPPALPSAPIVTASTDRPGDVTVSWSSVTAPAAPHYSYRVVAVGPSGESAPSAVAVGHLSERPVTGYEIQVGGGSWEAAVGISLVDIGAPAPTLVAGEASASQGTYVGHVELALASWESLPGATRGYRVRAVTAFGAGAASTEAIGRRQAGALQFAWERSADSSPADFAPLPGATGTTFQDSSLPPDGVVRYYRARLSAAGATSVTTAPVAGWRQPRPGVPQIASVTTELADRIEIRWAPVDGALAYHVYRGETRITSASGVSCAATLCSFSDNDAPAPGAWAAPTGVGASSDLTTGVNVTWTAPTRPLGASQSYRVSAINPSGESEPSTAVSGWRAAPALAGYEVQATVGANTTSHVVGSAVTSYLHAEAPMATFASATLTATRGDHRAHVRLGLSGGTLTAAATVNYQIRGTLEGGGSTGWSAVTSGRRATSSVTRTWQYAASENATTWSTLGSGICPSDATTCDDTTASPLGARRWYRVQLSAAGAQPGAPSPSTDGWRLSFEKISAGVTFTCAVTPLAPDGGRVWCWGSNVRGELGRGHTQGGALPERIPDFHGVVELELGSDHALARKSDGTVWCWGNNIRGECAVTGTNPITSPTRVGTILASNISADWGTACAISLDQRVLCWGSNAGSRLGRNAATPSSSATIEPVLSGPSTALTSMTRVSVGYRHVCAVQSGGALWCWGQNDNYQLGRQTPSSSTVALQVPEVADASEAEAGSNFSCYRQVGSTVRCFGTNGFGELGRGTFGPSTWTIATVTGTSGTAIGTSKLSLGYRSSCAILSATSPLDHIVCWGQNSDGQTGTGDTRHRATPELVVGLGPVAHVSVGGDYACALSEGGPHCWGNNLFTQLGVGDEERRLVPSGVLLP